MGAAKERPLLHAADLEFRWKLVRIAGVIVVCALLLIAPGYWGAVPSSGPKFEIYRLLLQFFLITVGGGVFLTLVGHYRDVASQRQERAAAVQELDRELDIAYRGLKKVKRRLRAHAYYVPIEDSRAAPDAEASLRIPRAVFEKSMDDLLDAQLRLETVCDQIGQRDDILRRDRLKRMAGPLHYASRYYHDVHEDFEKGRVRLEADHYILCGAANLNDYLRNSGAPAVVRPREVDYYLAVLKNERVDLPARGAAFKELLAVSPSDTVEGDDAGKPGKVRYADVAGACFDLLSHELAQVRVNLLS